MKLTFMTIALNLVLLLPSSCRSKEVLSPLQTEIITLNFGETYATVQPGIKLDFVLPIPNPPRAYWVQFKDGVSPCSSALLRGDTQNHPSCVVEKTTSADTTYSFTFGEGLAPVGPPRPGIPYNALICHHC